MIDQAIGIIISRSGGTAADAFASLRTKSLIGGFMEHAGHTAGSEPGAAA